MIVAEIPENEAERLAELDSYKVLDSELEESFKSITDIAAYICDAPISLISLVDPTRQWFKATHGIDATETPREIAFCSHAILQKSILEVPNTLEDIRFCYNPLVTGDPKIRAYFGAQLITSNGHNLGTLCVMDTESRDLTAKQKTILSQLSSQVIKLFELRRSRQIAMNANKAKSEFLSSMSHELRTPLNAILGFGQLLESNTETPLSKDQQESVDYILSSGQHLLHLINDVLDLSAIEAGAMEVSIENILLTNTINASVSLLQPIATKANITLHVLSDSALMVKADSRKLTQVLINLISNAIKYNKPEGSVTVEWTQTEHGTVKVTITDTGIGIPEDKKDKVFRAFNRLGQETSEIEGAGIGLLVTKNLIEIMSGTIGFDSTEGQGSRFWIELPLADEMEIIEEAETLETQEVAGKHILYVEDNPTNRRLMQSFFKRQPHTLDMEESAELGLEKALEHDYDLILMDIHLLGMDGKELTLKLRETDRYKSKPIVAITAAAMKEDIESAEGLFDDYVTKPLEFSKLLTLLNKYLS